MELITSDSIRALQVVLHVITLISNAAANQPYSSYFVQCTVGAS